MFATDYMSLNGLNLWIVCIHTVDLVTDSLIRAIPTAGYLTSKQRESRNSAIFRATIFNHPSAA